MKKIGLVDYYISEWHADNYPGWIKDTCAAKGLDYEVAYAWAEEYVSKVDGKNTDEWCRANGIERCMTLDELCEKSDVIIILAPSDPEKHLGYAKEVLKYGKRTYIDKTFAPDLKTAKEIFALGEQYNAPFFSSSALRYATELDSYENCRQTFVTGNGGNFAEYIIHLIEMTVKKLGVGAEKIMAEKFGTQIHLHIAYPDDRVGSVLFASYLLYTIYMTDGAPKGKTPKHKQIQSEFFLGLIADMLNFFETGEVSFDRAQTLEVMKLREGAILAEANPGEWIDLSKLG